MVQSRRRQLLRYGERQPAAPIASGNGQGFDTGWRCGFKGREAVAAVPDLQRPRTAWARRCFDWSQRAPGGHLAFDRGQLNFQSDLCAAAGEQRRAEPGWNEELPDRLRRRVWARGRGLNGQKFFSPVAPDAKGWPPTAVPL